MPAPSIVCPLLVRPSVADATPVVLSAITYSQSSVYPGAEAATPAEMQDLSGDETLSTATDYIAGDNWIQMDLGALREVSTIVIGCDYNGLLVDGPWTPELYTEAAELFYSADGVTWFRILVTLPAFTSPVQAIDGLSIAARYIRLANNDDYVAVTEFYATTD